MPPKRASPTKSAVAASPARSTRSMSRSVRGDDDDWENQSIVSSTTNGGFKVPNARTGRSSKQPLVGLKDTSVNVAAAFTAAQAGQLPTPGPDRSFPPPPRAKSSSKANNGFTRSKSPLEQVASSARAVGPAKYFLRPPAEDELDGDDSYQDPSFSSLGSGMRSTDTSYDYRQEEEFVRAAQEQREMSKGRRVSAGGRKKKGNDEDMPYRPAEDDWQPNSDESGGEGEGVVRGGGLEGRAGTRGMRKERGEGYLGHELGIQPRQRRKGHENGDGYDDDDFREQTPVNSGPPVLQVKHTPNGGGSNYRRSPTPAQTLARAFSPRRSPTPQFAKRKRYPSSGRVVITNLLHGVVLTLQFLVEVAIAGLRAVFVHPVKSVAGLGKQIMKRAKTDWWKWLGGLLALSLSLRLMGSPWWRGDSYIAPDLPPGSLEELVGRLQHLEKAVTLLSDSSKVLADAERVGKEVDTSLLHRISELESSISTERKRLDTVKGDETTDVKSLRKSIASLKNEVGDLSSRVGQNEKGLASTQVKAKRLDSLETDVQALRERVDVVEKDVKSALDDGRFRSALERILPHSMPVRINERGSVDIDPVFWTEMKKVLIGRSEIDEIIRKELKTVPPPEYVPDPWSKDDKDLEAWGDRLMERKRAEGLILTRSDFVELMEGEITNLKHIIDKLPRHAPTTQKSAVTIKSSKGDDVTSILQDLIDAALLKYSKDTLAKPDFALFSAGARAIPSLTTDTLVMSKPSFFGKHVLGQKIVEGRSPAAALHPDISVGSCWPFKGSEGQLGVMLNHPVTVTDLTIEHAPSDLALDVSTAPRDIEVWGVIEHAEDQAKVEEYLSKRPAIEASMEVTSAQFLLGTFTYDPSAPSHIQTFPVEPEIVELGLNVGIVIFKIKSNWGAEFTCLYRARVHGEVLRKTGA